MDHVLIDIRQFSDEEIEAIRKIEGNIHTLDTLASEYGLAFDLYIDCLTRKNAMDYREPERSKFWDWIRMAGRIGALNAYGFHVLLGEINKTKAFNFWARVDMESRKSALALFNKDFGAITGIRQPAAHPGELMRNPEEVAKHQATDPMMFVGLGCHNYPDRLEVSATFRGKWVGYELSERTVLVLYEVIQKYQEMLYPLESHVHRRQRAERREIDRLHRLEQIDRRRPWRRW